MDLAAHPSSSFDVAISGLLSPSTYIHHSDILAEIARVLKPNGKFLAREPAGEAFFSLLIYSFTIMLPLFEYTFTFSVLIAFFAPCT